MSTPDPLDDVAFLARSPHRVGVLKILADGPMTRRDLHDDTGISQPTLGRILEPFRDRNWVERRGQEYALTPWGHLLAEDFGELLNTVESIQRLSDVVQQLPTDEMNFDIREFRDATITTPESGDAFGHLRRLEELFFGADRARLLSPTVAMGSLEDYQETYQEFLDSDKQAESIVSVDTLAQVQADEMSAQMFRPAFETGRVKMFLYDGTIPFLLAVTDGTALLAPTDEHDIPVALVETRNEAIRSWVETRIEEYREESTALTVEDLP
ncbi:helix-turn-helix transcriptional regulator [Haladaptatus sp. DFWS20]|uniref:helix-turn-helix transcriptional regulator n=1 Tax=Haladaptatus sp. DFWS20 TaxID=3403467 RepID=UPI003EB7843F